MILKKIKYLDLKKINLLPIRKSSKKIFKYLKNDQYILDKNVEIFEKKFSRFNNASYCVGVNSGHDAIKIALMSLNIKHGDNVLVPSQTFISTWFAVSELGAKPVPIDINYSDGTIDVTKLPRKPLNVKALIAVNLFGNLCDYQFLKKYCKKNNIFLIEDSSQSHGAYLKKSKTYLNGDIACFSLFPGKNLGSITDAGCILTNSKKIFQKIKKIRNYGSIKKYHHEILGVNSRLNGLAAIFLSQKLKYLKKEIEIRSKQIKIYKKEIKPSSKIEFLECSKNQIPSNHIFLIKIKKRNKLRDYLKKNKIETIIHYPIIPLKQKYYLKFYNQFKKQCVNAEKLSKYCLSLPIGSHLSDSNISYVANKINFFNKKN